MSAEHLRRAKYERANSGRHAAHESGALEQLANDLAHKVRNSLNALRTHAALVERFAVGCAEPRLEPHVQKLQQPIDDIAAVIDAFVEVVGPAGYHCEEVDLQSLSREVFACAAPGLTQDGIAVLAEPNPDVPAVYVDRARFSRAVGSLVDNARQAMPGGGTLTVRIRQLRRGWVVLEVSDTGPGIPPEAAPNVFEPFVTTRPGRLGIGLAVAKRIVQDFGGRLSFESNGSGGATFRVELPAAGRRPAASARTSNGKVSHASPAGAKHRAAKGQPAK